MSQNGKRVLRDWSAWFCRYTRNWCTKKLIPELLNSECVNPEIG